MDDLLPKKSRQDFSRRPIGSPFPATPFAANEHAGLARVCIQNGVGSPVLPLNRDPLGEQGGANLYGFVANNPINEVDPLGMSTLEELNVVGDILANITLLGPPFTPGNRRNPLTGMQLIQVDKCHILLACGHNFVGRTDIDGLNKIWNIVPKDDKQYKGAAYAAVIGCVATSFPNEIPLPGYSPVSKVISAQDRSAETDLAREAFKAEQAAIAQAKKMCKDQKCACPRI